MNSPNSRSDVRVFPQIDVLEAMTAIGATALGLWIISGLIKEIRREV